MEPITTSRREFFTFAWTRASVAPPSNGVRHEDGGYESQLVDGRLTSYVEWPDFALTNQRHERVDLHRDVLAGRCVVLSFFYTQCKGSCPITAGRMGELAKVVQEQQRRVRFISISLEPEEDTPEALAAYAAEKTPANADWHLLTGDRAVITAVRRHLGFYDLNPALDADPRRHAAMVLMGNDCTHRWLTIPAVASLRQWRSTLSRCIA